MMHLHGQLYTFVWMAFFKRTFFSTFLTTRQHLNVSLCAGSITEDFKLCFNFIHQSPDLVHSIGTHVCKSPHWRIITSATSLRKVQIFHFLASPSYGLHSQVRSMIIAIFGSNSSKFQVDGWTHFETTSWILTALVQRTDYHQLFNLAERGGKALALLTTSFLCWYDM